MGRVSWTPNEVEQLLELHKTMTALQIADVLGRTENSVRNKLIMLTGSGSYQGDDPNVDKRPPWTEEDIEKLRELAASGKSFAQITKEMGRSQSAIRAKVFQHKIIVLGAEKRSWTEEEDEYLRENWGQVSLSVMSKNLHRTDVAIKQRACQVLELGRADELTDYVKIAEFCEMSGISRDRILGTLVPQHKFPIIRKVVLRRRQYFVDLPKVLKWMEKHQDLFDGSRISQDLFIMEPKWLTEKRLKDRETKEDIHSTAIIKIWTPQDILRLKDLVRIGYDYSDIAKEFGITRSQVERRIIQENISWTSPSFWQGSDFKFLRENWQTMSDEEIAKKLHKTTTSVMKQRTKQGYLRVGEKRHYTEKEKQFVRDNYLKMSDKELAEKLGRPLGGIKSLRLKLNLLREEHGSSN